MLRETHEARGTIDHDVVVFFGNVNIEGRANHDVVNFFGHVTAADESTTGPGNFIVIDPDGNPILVDQHV